MRSQVPRGGKAGGVVSQSLRVRSKSRLEIVCSCFLLCYTTMASGEQILFGMSEQKAL